VTDLSSLVQDNLGSARFFRPELALTFGTMALFLVDLAWKRHPGRTGRLAAAALLVLAVAAGLLAAQPVEPRALFNGMIATDGFATFFKWLFLAAAVLTVMISAPGKEFPPARLGEFYALLMAIVLGMFLMASAKDLLMAYLAIELVSMTSYVLAGFKKGDRRAAEASLKYVIYGGVASGVMLFGMSYLYGLTGTTSLLELAPRIAALGARPCTRAPRPPSRPSSRWARRRPASPWRCASSTAPWRVPPARWAGCRSRWQGSPGRPSSASCRPSP